MFKVFIDGKEGTTGLRIYERFLNRDDIELLTISEELRKDPVEKAKMINASDITFLCLPDKAAIESVALVTNPNVKIIDTSTAHRTNADWAYGFPELDQSFLENIKTTKRLSVPGCHASGAIAIIYPLVKHQVIPKDYPLSIFSLTGYSGGGKKKIAEYESDHSLELDSPTIYGLNQCHKHLREIVVRSNLEISPIFCPIIDDYYSGMVVTCGIITKLCNNITIKELYEIFKKHYANQDFVRVMPLDSEMTTIPSNTLSGKDYMEIFIFGNDERITISARFDNLGKGASGAAIECMNIMLGLDPKKGLVL